MTDYETTKVTDGGIRERGGTFQASVELISRARVVAAGAENVHFGAILCGCKLADSRELVDGLRDRLPDAIGGEMEGIGLAAACHRENTDWLLVKGISDWGFDKQD